MPGHTESATDGSGGKSAVAHIIILTDAEGLGCFGVGATIEEAQARAYEGWPPDRSIRRQRYRTVLVPHGCRLVVWAVNDGVEWRVEPACEDEGGDR
jgi:hypothetical protein